MGVEEDGLKPLKIIIVRVAIRTANDESSSSGDDSSRCSGHVQQVIRVVQIVDQILKEERHLYVHQLQHRK